jgi:hypothetical protein
MNTTHIITCSLFVGLTACAAPEFPEPAPGAPAALALPAVPAPPGQIALPAAAVMLAQAPVPPHLFKSDGFYLGKAARPLIIQSSDPDSKAYANLEEDLSVMYRILSKARGQEDENPFSSRLEDITLRASGSVGARNLYVEGHGAIFMMAVRFPLVAPETEEERPKPKETTSDEWERAKTEISTRNSFEVNLDRIVKISSAVEPYDSHKVEKLTSSIVESLKNGTHIRNLKADEFVTVVVFGPESATKRSTIEKVEQEEGSKARRKMRAEEISGGRSESTMTIRAKKSDIDDFAKGRLNADAFRKKAKILVYLRPIDASGAMNVMVAPAAIRK